ncbi:MAG: MBL fold metallo-hydrolase [Clostridiales bacterium]|nr:MBL fold metallo-hydrolase [Clostridiales bacterium]
MITYSPSLNLPFELPSWSDIFVQAGLTDNSTISRSPISVHFIDVGQGDCILIKTLHASALVDAGDRGKGEAVVQYLRNQNIEKLDYVFITHPDSDHIGGMPEVLENFKVSKFIMPAIKKENMPTTKIFEKLLNTIRNKQIDAETAVPQDVFNLGDATLTVLAPISSTSKLNNMSIVLRVVMGKNSFLLTGDAEIEEEMDMIKSGYPLQSDVLKAGHHGSKNSSGKDFLRAVRPKTVIVSCGRDNSYGHPSTEALERFSQVGAEVFRTDRHGSIVIGSDGENISIDYDNNKSK